MELQVLLTVPHSYCTSGDSTTNHYCDLTSTTSASTVGKHLSLLGLKWDLVTSDLWRGYCDANRSWCSELPFRQRVRGKLGPNVLLLDIHSFPSGGFGNSGDQVVLLPTEDGDMRAISLQRRLISSGLNVRILQGSKLNDVVDEGSKRVKYALLIEFSEKLTPYELELASSSVAGWAYSIVGNIGTYGRK